MDRIWLSQYQQGVAHDIDEGAYESLVPLFEESFRQFSDRAAFTNFGTTLTFSELDQKSQQFASFLQKDWNLRPGDRIAIMMPNLLQYPICLFGALRAGLTIVNVNPLYTAKELEYQLLDSEAQALIVFSGAAKRLQDIRSNWPSSKVLVTDLGDCLPFPRSLIINLVVKYIKKMVPSYHLPEALGWSEAMKKGAKHSFTPVSVTGDQLAFLQYTGGTTGVSKGAMLTHKNIIANILQAREWLNPACEKGKEIVITPLPLYHIFSLTANCFCLSMIGAHNILITNPKDIPSFVKELKKWNFSVITGVNTLFNALLNHPDFSSLNFDHLRITLGGGMAVQESVAKKWKEVTKTPLIEAYGLTETSPAACINPLNLKDYNGKIGVPISSTFVKVKDESNNDLPLGEVGEICIQGPQVMKGYWKKEKETDLVMTEDGFFRTGDLGFMDEQGYVQIVDRKKDMILVSGFNVYPNEVESIASEHEGVLECAAIGVPDEKSSEVVKLFVVKKDVTMTKEDLIQHCQKSLTAYKVPKHVEFRAELPKTNVGKILRRSLRDE